MKFFYIFLSLVPVSLLVKGQDKIDTLIDKINKIYFENRLVNKANVKEDIFVNKGNSTMDIGSSRILLNSTSWDYQLIFFNKVNKNVDAVSFYCQEGNCISSIKDSSKSSASSIFFTSKKACYDFINTVTEIKKNL